MSTDTTPETQDVVDYILGDQKARYSPQELELISRAYEFAARAHAGQTRLSGEPYVHHCVEVTRILVEMLRDPTTLAAALLHDTLEDCNCTLDQLAQLFGPKVASLVDGVTKISSLKLGGTREERSESLRKLMLAMARDLRVIIIKFADRIHNLRTLEFLPAEKQKRIAQETLDLLAPLAGRLGMSRVKAELEDLSMKYLYPEAYAELSAQLAAHREHHQAVIQKAINILRSDLESHHIVADIHGRAKHIYSIWKKMQRQGIGLDSVYDIMAVRVVCAGTADTCYTVLGIIHNRWRPLDGRFRDFIALPKENGYQSIHTTVLGPENERLEIQIRTREMHRLAEEGIASHWKYKEGVRGEHELEEKLTWLRRLVDWIKDVHDPQDFLSSLKGDLTSETVFCFTPRGDIIEMPKGATALDFAYYVHTSIGETCVGAIVNHRMVPLRYELKTGDVVEIKTSAKGHPSVDWLEIVKTSRARTKIKHWLRSQWLNEENIQKGKEALAKALRARGLPIDWEDLRARIAPMLKHYLAQSFDELCGEIGFGGIAAPTIVGRAYPEVPRSRPRKPKTDRSPRRHVRPVGVVVGDIPEAVVRFAACCGPVPGDPILGFVTVGRGVTIHTERCPTLRRLRDDEQLRPRIIPAHWDLENLPVREVGLRVECTDRVGLLADVTSAITSTNVFIIASKTKSKGDLAVLQFVVQIKNLQQLSQLFSVIRSVKGVLRVTRVAVTNDTV